MKKGLSALLILALCFTAVFGLSACDGKEKEEVTTMPAATVITEPWKADAASGEMKKYTKFFRFASVFDALVEYSEGNSEYDPKNPFTDDLIRYETEELDNRMSTLISCFEAEKNSHPFAEKYLDELSKTNYTELSDADKFIFESYSKLLISDRVHENGNILETNYFKVDTVKANMINELVYASCGGTGEDIYVEFWFPSDISNVHKLYKFFADGKRILFDGMGKVSVSTCEEDETELDVEAVKQIINDNISFFEFLVEYRDTVYAQIRDNEERETAQNLAPDFYSKLCKVEHSGFTNKFGSPDTKCVVPGCSQNIASSGDTNCCKSHSNKCGNCNCYIDGDAMFCMSCIENYISSN